MSDSTTKSAKVYIYVLQRISDKAYLYIGSAKNPQQRFNGHRCKNHYPIIQTAFAENNIRFLVIASTDAERRLEMEHVLWRQFIEAGHPIVNIDPALTTYKYGEASWLKGKTLGPRSKEIRQKISESNKGKPKSKEHCKHLSESRKGFIPWIAGKHHSEETKQKMSKAKKGRPRRPLSEETKRKISEANKGKSKSDVHRQHMSESKKGKPAYNKGIPGRPHTEDELRRMSESMKKRWAQKRKHIDEGERN